MKQKHISLIAVLIALILLAMLGVSYKPTKLTLISIDQAMVEPTGYEEAEKYKGVYWVITMVADISDAVALVKLYTEDDQVYVETDTGEKKTVENTISTGEKVVTQKEIRIEIDPQTPYYLRQMEIASVEVAPKAWKNVQGKVFQDIHKDHSYNTDPLYSGHYEWAPGSQWEEWAPFTIRVFEGASTTPIAVKTINTEFGSKSTTIPVSGEDLIITNLGMLDGAFKGPVGAVGNVMYFTSEHIYERDSQSIQYVTSPYPTANPPGGGGVSVHCATEAEAREMSYATYWFVRAYYNDDGTPAPHHEGGTGFVSGDDWGGWINADTWDNWVRVPVRPTIYDKSELPPEKRGFMSLVEYLTWQQVTKYELNYGAGSPEIRWDRKLKVGVPFSAYESHSLFTIMIPVELADTVIWNPPAADVKIESAKIPAEIGDMYQGSVTLKQYSSARSTAHVYLTFEVIEGELGESPVQVTPDQFDVTLDPDEVANQTLMFLHAGSESSGKVRLTIRVESLFGIETDKKTYDITYLPKGVGTTSLIVYTMDAETEEFLSGIFVSIKWDTESKGAYTSEGYHAFDMGSYTGMVIVTSAETSIFKSAETSVNLIPGANSVTLNLHKWGEPPPEEEDWTMLLVALVALVAVAASVSYAVKKRKRRNV